MALKKAEKIVTTSYNCPYCGDPIADALDVPGQKKPVLHGMNGRPLRGRSAPCHNRNCGRRSLVR